MNLALTSQSTSSAKTNMEHLNTVGNVAVKYDPLTHTKSTENISVSNHAVYYYQEGL